jgi:hypothetical protein
LSSMAFGQTQNIKDRLEKARMELLQHQTEIELIKNSILQQETERMQNMYVAVSGGLIALGTGVVGKYISSANLNDGLHRSLVQTLIKFLKPQSILRKFHEQELLAALNLNRQVLYTKVEYFNLQKNGQPAAEYFEMQARNGVFVVVDESFAPTFVHKKLTPEDLQNMKRIFMPYVTSLSTSGYNGIRALIRSDKIGQFKKDLESKSKLLSDVQKLLNTVAEQAQEGP